jgi:hypothetical protein
MQLTLANVESCTATGCRVRFLEENGKPVDIPYSALMQQYAIRVRPGQVVAVDRNAESPEMLWRFGVYPVERLDGDTALLAGKPFRLRDGRPSEEQEHPIRTGDTVVVRSDDATGGLEVYDLVVNGQPLHPERLRAAFPLIIATYQGAATP